MKSSESRWFFFSSHSARQYTNTNIISNTNETNIVSRSRNNITSNWNEITCFSVLQQQNKHWTGERAKQQENGKQSVQIFERTLGANACEREPRQLEDRRISFRLRWSCRRRRCCYCFKIQWEEQTELQRDWEGERERINSEVYNVSANIVYFKCVCVAINNPI